MPVLFKNVTPTERIPHGSIVRVAFAQEHSAIARDASFASDFNSLWPKLFNVGGIAYPIGLNPSLRGDTVAVVDFRFGKDSTPAELVRALDGISGYWIEVTSLERLGALPASKAASNAGATERESVKMEAYKDAASGDWMATIARGAGATLTTVKWVAILALVLTIVYLINTASSQRR